MDQKYWLGRKRSSLALARNATSSEARLIQYDLAGRYAVRAADAGNARSQETADTNDGRRVRYGTAASRA